MKMTTFLEPVHFSVKSKRSFFVNKKPTYFNQFRTGLVQSSSFNSPKMTAVWTGAIRVFSCESVCLGLTLKFWKISIFVFENVGKLFSLDMKVVACDYFISTWFRARPWTTHLDPVVCKRRNFFQASALLR